MTAERHDRRQLVTDERVGRASTTSSIDLRGPATVQHRRPDAGSTAWSSSRAADEAYPERTYTEHSRKARLSRAGAARGHDRARLNPHCRAERISIFGACPSRSTSSARRAGSASTRSTRSRSGPPVLIAAPRVAADSRRSRRCGDDRTRTARCEGDSVIAAALALRAAAARTPMRRRSSVAKDAYAQAKQNGVDMSRGPMSGVVKPGWRRRRRPRSARGRRRRGREPVASRYRVGRGRATSTRADARE